MEKGKKLSNILVTVIIVLVLLLGGFIAYDKFLKKDNSSNQNANTSTNSYQIFSANLKKKITSMELGTFLAEDSFWTNYGGNYDITYRIILTNKMELIMVFDDQKYKSKYGEITIANDVISFTIVQAGPGAYQNIYFINDNGTVGVAEPYDMFNENKGKLPVTNPLPGLKNIVAIVQGTFDGEGSTKDPYAIDINGNTYAIQSAWD